MIHIRNINLINLNPAEVKFNYDILIEKNLIVKIEKNIRPSGKKPKTIDGTGKYIMPGLVCAHNHFYSVLSRGILASIPHSVNFVEILKNLWWRLDRAHNQKSIYYSGLIGSLEAIKNGTTAVIDHHASPNFIKGSLSALEEGISKTGLRRILAYEITDRNGKTGAIQGIGESKRFFHETNSELIKTSIGAHASFTLSDKTLQSISSLLKETKTGIHIHVAEDKADVKRTREKYHTSICKRLEKFDLLNDKALLVHGVHLNKSEIEIINNHNSFLIHNPRSNMNNSVGYMKQILMIDNCCIGTDGIGSDMFEECRFAYFKSKEARVNLHPNQILKLLFNGNRILSRYFNKKFGRIAEGFEADLIITDYKAATPINEKNLGSHFIFGFSSKNVETSIIGGKIVYENRSFPFEVESIYAESRRQAVKLWERMNKIKP
jgi:putative selenium metabolism protein SsnA